MLDNDDITMVPVIDVEYLSENATLDRWLFHRSPLLFSHGVVLPITACLGVLLNLSACCLYLHRDMRSVSTMLLKANLITDSVCLVTLTLMVSPKVWLYRVYEAGRYDTFWDQLSGIQSVYMGCYPIHQISICLSQWYTMALIGEQCVAFVRPDAMARWASRNKDIKLVVTLLNVAIIIHIISFFKFIRRKNVILHYPVGIPRNDSATPTKHVAHKICLSVIYQSSKFSAYDKYVYLLCFEVIPWAVALCCFAVCVIVYIRHKRNMQGIIAQDAQLLRALKCGRSVRMVMTVTAASLCLKAVAHGMNILVIPHQNYGDFDNNCYLTPTDVRFLHVPSNVVQTFLFANVINCSIKPLLCIMASYDLRRLMSMYWRRKKNKISEASRRVYIIVDVTRPKPPEIQ